MLPLLRIALGLCASAPLAVAQLDVAITSPADGASVAGAVLIQGTSNDVQNGVVSVSIDGGPFAPAQGTDSWSFAWDSASVGDGAHSIRARARQCLGCPAVFDEIQVQVVNAGGAPSVSITWPPDGSQLVDTVTLQGVSSGASSVSVSIDGGPPQAVNGLASWDFVLEPGVLAPGPHTLTASATAASGSSASDSIGVDVQPPGPGVQNFVYASSVDAEPLTSKLYLPPGFDTSGAPTALVVHLHGGGGKGSISSAMQAELDARGWVGIAPDGRFWDLFGAGCTWETSAAYVDHPDPLVGPGEQDIFDAIDWAQANLPIDPSRIYLTGFSMGGRGTYGIGLRNPDRFAAIAPMGPASDMFEVYARRPEPCVCKEGMVGGAPGDSLEVDTFYRITSGRFLLENAYNLPVFHAHGTLDTVASNTLANAPFLHGWHLTSDAGWSAAHQTPSSTGAWGNSCYAGSAAALPLSFGFGHTPTLGELSAAHPGAYDWALYFSPVGHVTDPQWLSGGPAAAGSTGVPDPNAPGQLLGIYDWFEARTLQSSPDSVVYKTYTDTHREAFWVGLDSATPWLAQPAAVRASRDAANNALVVEAVRASAVEIELDQAQLAVAPGPPLQLTLSKLVEPSFDPALDAAGEAQLTSLVLDGVQAQGLTPAVLIDDTPAAPNAVVLAGDELRIGPLDLFFPRSLEVFACGGYWRDYAPGWAGSNGVEPRLELEGCAQVGGQLSLGVSGGLPHAPGLFAIGTQETHVVLPSGLSVWVGPFDQLTLLPIALDASGSWSLPWAIAAGAAGQRFTLQSVLFDAALFGQLSASDAVELVLP